MADSSVDSIAPYTMTNEPPLSFRAEGYDYDHEVLVSLPTSYSVSPDRSYPVVWAMDGAMMHMSVVGLFNMYALAAELPETIVVSVGHSSDQGIAGISKRAFDLIPPGSLVAGDKVAERYYLEKAPEGRELIGQSAELKADKFLDFLIDKVRPALAKRYRMSDDHALIGHSAGGYFTGYSLFARPGGFSRYLIGSGTHAQTIELEEKYAKSHEDLPARVFLSAGNEEVTDPELAAGRLASRTIFLAENLAMRQYPSLGLKCQLYTDRNHITVIPPMLADGLQFLYADEIEKLPPPKF